MKSRGTKGSGWCRGDSTSDGGRSIPCPLGEECSDKSQCVSKQGEARNRDFRNVREGTNNVSRRTYSWKHLQDAGAHRPMVRTYVRDLWRHEPASHTVKRYRCASRSHLQSEEKDHSLRDALVTQYWRAPSPDRGRGRSLGDSSAKAIVCEVDH